ncbi:hypothetical protein FH608_018795 [Nonomuraea phyllanthi]|uniref:Uncharacterized protein n=1 Tax=Nonomuraea phyllanthi TaxID=2219224 RepID=A0A5C4WIX3_9ACTN|nr:hypothetical protein FH608_018795 [Nonomuraea phyllanthi]
MATGVLVIFDRRPEAPPWRERGGFEQATTPSGRRVTVLRAWWVTQSPSPSVPPLRGGLLS